MATTFITSLGSKLAERWVASLLAPAFVFWAGGLGAWIYQLGDKQRKDFVTWLTQLPDFWKIALLVGSLLVVVSSGVIVERLDLAVLRFLEGYWPLWLRPLRYWLIKQKRSKLRQSRWQLEYLDKKKYEGLTAEELERYWASYWPYWLRPVRGWLRPFRDRWTARKESKLRRLQNRFQSLDRIRERAGGHTGFTVEEFDEYETLDLHLQEANCKLQGLTSKEEEEYARFDLQLMQAPADFQRLMPTRLGNLLRAAEMRPLDKYGLDAVICWSRLWIVLPENVQKDLTETRAELNLSVRVWLWSLLFLIWGIWAWWAIAIGLLSALLTYRWILSAAAAYGDLIEAAFDMHRGALYKSLRWPLPKNPKEERQKGEAVTNYLLSSSEQDEPQFIEPGKD